MMESVSANCCEDALADGALALMKKPFDASALLEAVNQAVSKGLGG
jgi:FixJ family two-component response regulator